MNLSNETNGGIGWKIFKVILYTIFWVIIVLAIVIGINLYCTYPIYPAFQKEVSSYGELQKELEKTQEIYLADLSEKKLTDTSWILLLDGRDRFSHPDGYDFTGNILIDNTEVRYCVRCEKIDWDYKAPQAPEITYRDIPIAYVVDSDVDVSYHKGNVNFAIGQYYYSISASYYCIPLSEESRIKLDETIKVMLLEDSRQVIDRCLGRR